MEREHLVPGEDVVRHAVLREFRILDGSQSDGFGDVLLLILGERGVLFFHNGTGTLDGFLKDVEELHVVAISCLHDLAITAQDTAVRDVRHVDVFAPHLGRGKDLLEVQLLRCADDIPDLVGIQFANPVVDGGEITGGVVEAAVSLTDDCWLLCKGGNVSEEDAHGAITFLSEAFLGQLVHDGA